MSTVGGNCECIFANPAEDVRGACAHRARIVQAIVRFFYLKQYIGGGANYVCLGSWGYQNSAARLSFRFKSPLEIGLTKG